MHLENVFWFRMPTTTYTHTHTQTQVSSFSLLLPALLSLLISVILTQL